MSTAVSTKSKQLASQHHIREFAGRITETLKNERLDARQVLAVALLVLDQAILTLKSDKLAG